MATKTRKGYLSHFPEHWKVYRIDELLDRIKNKVDVKKEELYTQIGIRSHGKGLFYKEPVTGEELGNKSVFWVEPDCFIVNIVFAWEMAVAKTTSADVGLIGSHRFPMYKPKPELLDLDFLLYYFKMPLGKYLLGLASPGGAGRNKTLGQKEFAELEICIPPIDQQKEIVSILSTWDNGIALKKQLVDEKNLQKEGLLHLLLSEENQLEGFISEWDFVEFEKAFQKVPITKNQISSKEYLIKGTIPVIDQGKKKIVAYSNSLDKAINIPKDGLIIFGDHTREIKFVDYDFIVGADGVQVLDKKNGFDIKFLYACLQNIDIPNMGYSRHFKLLKEKKIPKPAIEEQKAIAEILSSADKEISLLEKELNETIEQKRGLMQQILTGKKRVEI